MTDGYRKAALKLHGMGEADRKWVLQRLQAHERTQISALMRELKELGIKACQLIAEDISAHDARQELLQVSGKGADFVQALDSVCGASAAELSALLSSEPDNMVTVILSAYPWPWRARLLADYGVEKRQRISRMLPQAPHTRARMRCELIKVLAARLKTLRSQRHSFVDHGAEELLSKVKQRPAQLALQGFRRWLP
jgi:flagellar motor switch protein FliG